MPLLPHPSTERLEGTLARMSVWIRERFAIEVRFIDVQPPFLGDLDGAEIRLQRGHDPSATLFTLAHLFGHTVQWNLSEHARSIGAKPDGAAYTPADLEEIRQYEADASRYGLQLLHELGVDDLDQWLSDFAACDFAYLRHFYRTGDHTDPMSFWRDGMPLLSPLPIPRFTPRHFKYRWDGVVV
jgi:hypothetical protein